MLQLSVYFADVVPGLASFDNTSPGPPQYPRPDGQEYQRAHRDQNDSNHTRPTKFPEIGVDSTGKLLSCRLVGDELFHLSMSGPGIHSGNNEQEQCHRDCGAEYVKWKGGG